METVNKMAAVQRAIDLAEEHAKEKMKAKSEEDSSTKESSENRFNPLWQDFSAEVTKEACPFPFTGFTSH